MTKARREMEDRIAEANARNAAAEMEGARLQEELNRARGHQRAARKKLAIATGPTGLSLFLKAFDALTEDMEQELRDIGK